MRKLIRTDGTIVECQFPLTFKQVHALLDCETLDVIALKSEGAPLHVMLVADKGYETESVTEGNTLELRPVRALKPVNVIATVMYWQQCQPGTTHKIVGDVYICPDSDHG